MGDLGNVRPLNLSKNIVKNTTNLEASIAAIRGSIELEKDQISNLRNLYYQHDLYGLDESERLRISNNLFEQYEKYVNGLR